MSLASRPTPVTRSSTTLWFSFSIEQSDATAQAHFHRCLELLYRFSETFETQQQEDSPNSPGAEVLGSGCRVTSPAIQDESLLAPPKAVPWWQTRQLPHTLSKLLQPFRDQAVKAKLEQAEDRSFNSQGFSDQKLIPDAELCAQSQAVEQRSTSQEKLQRIQNETEGSGLVVWHRQKPAVVEEAKGSEAPASVLVVDPPSVSEPPSNEVTETGEANAIVPHGKHRVAAKAKNSAVRTARAAGLLPPGDATGTAQASLPPGQDPLEPQPQRTAKRYSAVEHPAALVRALRERYQLSQENFARKVDVAFITVNRWENGHSMPHAIAIARLKKLTKKLGDRGEDLLEQHFPDEFEKLKKKQGLNSAKG